MLVSEFHVNANNQISSSMKAQMIGTGQSWVAGHRKILHPLMCNTSSAEIVCGDAEDSSEGGCGSRVARGERLPLEDPGRHTQ